MSIAHPSVVHVGAKLIEHNRKEITVTQYNIICTLKHTFSVPLKNLNVMISFPGKMWKSKGTDQLFQRRKVTVIYV